MDTGENHADLSDAYASIPFEMKKVSQYFNKEVLTQITESDLFNHAHHIRKICGDRSFLRAYHLLEENQRVDQLEQALVRNDFKLFDQLIIESGNSSALYLQNVICDFEKQSLMLALAMAQSYLRDAGSYRIHGGGFAGTILAFVPKEYVLSFCKFMELMFMENCCQELFIRPVGTYVFNYDGS